MSRESRFVRGLDGRTSAKTSFSRIRSAAAIADPTKPLAPVTSTGDEGNGFGALEAAVLTAPERFGGSGFRETQPRLRSRSFISVFEQIKRSIILFRRIACNLLDLPGATNNMETMPPRLVSPGSIVIGAFARAPAVTRSREGQLVLYSSSSHSLVPGLWLIARSYALAGARPARPSCACTRFRLRTSAQTGDRAIRDAALRLRPRQPPGLPASPAER